MQNFLLQGLRTDFMTEVKAHVHKEQKRELVRLGSYAEIAYLEPVPEKATATPAAADGAAEPSSKKKKGAKAAAKPSKRPVNINQVLKEVVQKKPIAYSIFDHQSPLIMMNIEKWVNEE